MANWHLPTTNRLLRAAAEPDASAALAGVLQELAALGIREPEGPAVTVWLELAGPAHPLRLVAVEDPGPEAQAFVANLLGMVLQRRAEQAALAEVRERADMLSRASFEGILVHKNGFVIDVNESLEQLLGTPREGLLGPDTLPKCVVEEDLPRVLQLMREGYEGTYVITGVRANGERFLAELQSKQGKLGDEPVRVAAVRDVTERERTLELLRESETQLRALVESVFDLTVLSRDGVMIDVSGGIPGMPQLSEDAIGRMITDFVAPTALPEVRRQILEDRIGTYRSTLLSSTGEQIPVEVVATNTTLQGRPVRIAGVRDRREAERRERERLVLQQQVERAQRLDSLGVLAGGIAHDFNNLLVGILGNAELLLLDLPAGEPREMAETIRSASLRARELTQRLMTYAGETSLAAHEGIDLQALCRELDRLTEVTRPPDVRLRLRFEPGCMLLGERGAITQVVLNLIRNAIDAIGSQPGLITVSAAHVTEPDARWDQAFGATVGPGDWIQLEVTDTGPGMEGRTLSRIFEPFFTTKPSGHGLGLASTLGILQAHGGAVHVVSELGRGTTFALLLPAATATPHVKPGSPRSSPPPGHVLLVDDEPMIRKQIRRTLTRRGYQVAECSDGPACLAHLRRTTPDLIVMDMTMPGPSGAETAQAIRERGISVPIVLTSGYVPASAREDFAPGLFQAYLQKPYSIDELLEAIARATSAGHLANRADD